jgi:exodeoxyribonuclease V alpha subunit
VDEAAMINWEIHRTLFDALPNGGRIRLFGDNNQLKPIEEDKALNEAPSPFMTLLANEKFVRVTLKTVFRQGADSGILLNANNILRSRVPTKNAQWDQKITDQPVQELVAYVKRTREEGVADFSGITDQIIVPQNTSWVGTRKLNALLQGLFFNEHDPCMLVPRRSWVEGIGGEKGGDIKMHVGDKVMFTTNNYDLGIFNGEAGRIIEIDAEYGEIVVDFGDREQAIPPIQMITNSYGGTSTIDPRKDLDLAYAVTTHKCQGSEFRRVVYIMNKSNMFMLTRANFYTAITRAKQHVYVIADQRGFSAGVYKRG